jgi:hypothetical protein
LLSSSEKGLARVRDIAYTAYYIKQHRQHRREVTVMDPRQRLSHYLAAQRFPADRWELIVSADHDGADIQTKNELYSLPAVRFRSLADVLHAVERSRKEALAREPDARSA